MAFAKPEHYAFMPGTTAALDEWANGQDTITWPVSAARLPCNRLQTPSVIARRGGEGRCWRLARWPAGHAQVRSQRRPLDVGGLRCGSRFVKGRCRVAVVPWWPGGVVLVDRLGRLEALWMSTARRRLPISPRGATPAKPCPEPQRASDVKSPHRACVQPPANARQRPPDPSAPSVRCPRASFFLAPTPTIALDCLPSFF